jgi:hypothetical protein
MTDNVGERRRYTRARIDLAVEVHQGGSMWRQRLIDLSLAGAATDQPDVWDAQYNEPFTLIIHAPNGPLELHAYLQHVENGRLGFSVQHVDRKNIEPLRALLAAHVDDPLQLDAEISQLD